MIPTHYYLILSAILFGLGVVGFIFRRNIITVFMSIELMLNAVNLTFVAFSQALEPTRRPDFRFLRDGGGGGGSRRRPRHHHSHSAQPPVAQRRARGLAQTLMPILDNLWIIPLLPLLGSAINGLFGAQVAEQDRQRRRRRLDGPLVCLGARSRPRILAALAGPDSLGEAYFTWIAAGTFRVGFDLQVDRLTAVMLMVVTGVGSLIHIYSIGYMAHEGGYYRFFAYLNLFMFFMLMLVLAANYLLLFVGWEGVGLCSYLLIGFYFLRKVRHRRRQQSVHRQPHRRFRILARHVPDLHDVRLARFRPGVRESSSDAGRRHGPVRHAHRRLPAALRRRHRQIRADSALRLAARRHGRPHAGLRADPRRHHGHRRRLHGRALARSFPALRPAPCSIVAIIGCATAFFAATIGLVQNDIKKVFAYSTVSQLGYMFLACGVGAFSAGIFHLMTHAFFKALLFLGAGSVIHALGGEQDMRKMGGLRKKIPWTFITMLTATLAIAGFPPFAGFFSKDAILLSAYPE